ncbi:hypothetical protein ACFWPV_18480 [Streptomyces uncialis]|uniref:hypothetical protein n=1 Tax=Streptomyces uncialis TaxID=1048205 RepID=UPI003669E636
MAWDEWDRIKAGVAERQSTGTQLNGVPVEPGEAPSAVTGGLKSSKKAWIAAGDGVGSLRTSVSTAVGKLEDGQSGLGAADGCLTAAAQKDVHASWKKYAEAVGERCASLQKIMEQVGHDQLTTDQGVKSEVDALKRAHADTEAVGGDPAKGR